MSDRADARPSELPTGTVAFLLAVLELMGRQNR
jgi:hypothetical protein